MQSIEKSMKNVDWIIELRDARAPISSANPWLNDHVHAKNKILVLNKSDLTDPKVTQEWRLKLNSDKMSTLALNAVCQNSVQPVLRLLEDRYRMNNFAPDRKIQVMVVGMPNVGKSTFINSLRHISTGLGGKPAVIGPRAGVTRHLQTIRLLKSAPVYLCDTPGIFVPKIDDFERGLKLACIGLVNDQVLDLFLVNDFLLYSLNKNEEFNYTKVYKLDQPENDAKKLFIHICNLFDWRLSNGKLDGRRACEHFLKKFRKGELGKITFD